MYALNSQGFHFLERSKINLITSTAGYWSAGALSTAILSGVLVGRVGLIAHVNFLCVTLTIAMIAIVSKTASCIT